MSRQLRITLLIILTLLMALSSFAAGYLTHQLRAEQGEWRLSADRQTEYTLFDETWERVRQSFLGDLPAPQQINYAAIRGSLQTLQDPYTIFLEPVVRQEERETLRGSFGGIGAYLSRNEEGALLLEPIPNNPAAKSGVQSGDLLLAIDGERISSDLALDQIVEKLKGDVGTEVALLIGRDGQEQTITIQRGEVLIPSVISRILPQAPTIGYIQLTRFSGESGDEVKNAILSLQEMGAKQYVLDLRDNGGGLLDAAIQVSSHFLDQQVVYLQTTREETERIEKSLPNPILPTEPLVVLINGGTASSAEIVAGALQDNQRAQLIGERSYGKGSVQLVYDLSDGSSVHVTAARWFTPNGRQLDQNGLLPDIESIPTAEGRELGRDEQLERAVNFLLEQP